MYSLLLTLIFYIIAGLIVYGRFPKQARLLAWGSLPIVWVSVLALLGLLETLLSIPTLITIALLFCGLIWSLFRFHRNDFRSISRTPTSVTFWILLAFLIGEFIIASLVHSRVPWGSWDPMFTWIMRARFLVDGGDLWTQGFSKDLALLHPDYPPLFSWALVPLWNLEGSQSSLSVASLTIPFFSALVLVLAGWGNFVIKRSSLWGNFTIAIVLGTPVLIYLHSVKSLDFILSYAILTSLAWYQYSKTEQDKSGWTICAYIVAWSALVKNEGQLWIVSFFGTLILLHFLQFFTTPTKRESKPKFSSNQILIAILKGAMIPVCFLIWFKVSLAPPTDLIEPQRAFEISQVIQPDVMFNPYSLLVRLDQAEQWQWHEVIWNQLWNLMFDWKVEAILLWSTLLLLLINLLQKRKAFPWILIAVGVQLTGYYCVYLLTPYNPFWHVSTSMNRLLIHVTPAALCLLGFALGSSAMNSKTTSKAAPAFLSLSLVSLLFCYSQIHSQIFPWNFPSESQTQDRLLAEIDFPQVSHATFVTDQFEPATVYQMQFAAVPTVLVVDRREKILLASFPTEQELKTYCEQNGWELKKHREGLGWAESISLNGPLPHMDQIEKQNR